MRGFRFPTWFYIRPPRKRGGVWSGIPNRYMERTNKARMHAKDDRYAEECNQPKGSMCWKIRIGGEKPKNKSCSYVCGIILETP